MFAFFWTYLGKFCLKYASLGLSGSTWPNTLSEADPRAPKRSKKPSAFNPTVPSQTGPKGPFGALWAPPQRPMGPLGPPSFATERLHNGARVRRSESATERQYDGASLSGRRVVRASVNNQVFSSKTCSGTYYKHEIIELMRFVHNCGC